jgi:Tol biopolymer transport system component
MNRRSLATLVSQGLVALLAAGCRSDSTGTPPAVVRGLLASEDAADDPRRFSDWSAPVNLGPVVNTASIEQGESISKDGLSLYFHSVRPEGFGGADIYVSHRAQVGDAWEPPQNLGLTINTPDNEQAPRLSRDGHQLFFSSDRPGGVGGHDLYVSRRHDKRDDLAWESAVNLGPGINSTQDDQTPDPFEDDASRASVLYLGSGPIGSGGTDIYVSTLQPDGAYGLRVPVTELNSPSLDRQPSIGRDGLEIFLASDRPGTLGGLDLWVATRARTSDHWSTPVNVGTGVNSTLIDARPALSFDGTTLYFQSTRPGAVGCTSPTGPCVFDLWVTTRSRLVDADDDEGGR